MLEPHRPPQFVAVPVAPEPSLNFSLPVRVPNRTVARLSRLCAARQPMPSKPIPGSTGDVLTCLPSPYVAHAGSGLLYLPRFLAKCDYVKRHGALPASYAKNYKRGLDRFLCMHLGIDPGAVEKVVFESASPLEIETKLAALLPADRRVAKWNRELVQKGMTDAGREFLKVALTAMGCADRADEIKSVPDLIDFDEGRIE